MSWIGCVTSIIVSSLTSYLLYCLPENGNLSDRNLWEVTVYKTYFTSWHYVNVSGVFNVAYYMYTINAQIM